jgi:hypothetical protein
VDIEFLLTKVGQLQREPSQSQKEESRFFFSILENYIKEIMKIKYKIRGVSDDAKQKIFEVIYHNNCIDYYKWLLY